MARNKCQLLNEHEKRNLIETIHIIDLTDKPIGLARNEIGWSKVRSTASNCICCCYNNSITLVTSDNSYALDHVPLDNIQVAQVNPSLKYLALSNLRKLVVTDLIDQTARPQYNCPARSKVVNLVGQGLTMSDILFWRWIDDFTLAVLSYEALYVCSINNPLLSLEKVFDVNPHISSFCQVYDIQRDVSTNLYAISSLYSTDTLLKTDTFSTISPNRINTYQNARLRHSSSSMPAHLSQLQYMEQLSFDSVRLDQMDTSNGIANDTSCGSEDIVCGLVQIHSKVSNRSQLIQAHAVTYACNSNNSILVAAIKLSDKMRVNFIEMETMKNQVLSGQNASSTTSFDRLSDVDFPTSIVCSKIESEQGTRLHVALITTKHGQLFVCSVAHSTILFNTQIATDIISSTVLDLNTQGIMIICRNGQVLLIKLNLPKLIKLLDESKTLRYITSSHNISSLSAESIGDDDSSIGDFKSIEYKLAAEDKLYSPLETGVEVLMSTKL